MYKIKELCDLHLNLENDSINASEAIQKLIEYLPPTDLFHSIEWKEKRLKILEKECIICKSTNQLTLQHHFHPPARSRKTIEYYIQACYNKHKSVHYPHHLIRPIKYFSYIKGFINEKRIIPADLNEIKNLPLVENEDKARLCNNCKSVAIRYRKKTNEYVCSRCKTVGNDFFDEYTSYRVDYEKQALMIKEIVDSYYQKDCPPFNEKESVLDLINQTILYRSMEIGVFTYCKKCAYIEDKENGLLSKNFKTKITHRLKTYEEEKKNNKFYDFVLIDQNYSAFSHKDLITYHSP